MEIEILISERREKKVVYTPELCTGCGISSQMCPKAEYLGGIVDNNASMCHGLTVLVIPQNRRIFRLK